MDYNFRKIKLHTEGDSHSARLDVRIEGLPQGECFDMQELQIFMDRRHGDGSNIAELCSTARREPDIPVFDGGIRTATVVANAGEGIKTCKATEDTEDAGTAEIINSENIHTSTIAGTITAHIDNKDVRSADYDNLRTVLRPGHSDLGAYLKYGREGLKPGGGEFSGRMTATLCLAGGIAKQILEKRGVYITAHIAEIGGLEYTESDREDLCSDEFEWLVLNTKEALIERIEQAGRDGDSLGGVVGCRVVGYPGGIGGPGMDGLEGDLARAMLAIPSAKGVDFGSGFAGASFEGSLNNDEYFLENGRIVTKCNLQGGISGGISTGMDISMCVAFKPVPSISREQRTVDIEKMEETVISINGRHDVCIVPRVLPVVEAMAALVLLDRLEDAERAGGERMQTENSDID